MRPYNDYNSYLKEKFGCRVYRIGLDAHLSCPNRDGTKGAGGCAYCNEYGSRSSYTDPAISVTEQLNTRIDYLKKKYGAQKYIAYFQAFSNTYAAVDKLKKIYDEVIPFKEVVGLSIGTRPDTIDRDKLRLISSYKERYDIWLEYGLQSIHDKTLKAMNRGHDFQDFLNALKAAKEFDIPVCAHIILGLPGETRDDMIRTARKLTALGINGIKIHLFHILKGSALEQMYQSGRIKMLEQEEYIKLVCDFLENLSKDIIVQRLTGEGDRENHVAPLWALDKIGTITKIGRTLKNRGAFQGSAISWSRSEGMRFSGLSLRHL